MLSPLRWVERLRLIPPPSSHASHDTNLLLIGLIYLSFDQWIPKDAKAIHCHTKYTKVYALLQRHRHSRGFGGGEQFGGVIISSLIYEDKKKKKRNSIPCSRSCVLPLTLIRDY